MLVIKVGELQGIRMWQVQGGKLHSISILKTYWEIGKRAEVVPYIKIKHSIDDIDYTSLTYKLSLFESFSGDLLSHPRFLDKPFGFYALKETRISSTFDSALELESADNYVRKDLAIIGTVDLYGNVVEGANGYRAEYAHPTGLYAFEGEALEALPKIAKYWGATIFNSPHEIPGLRVNLYE